MQVACVGTSLCLDWQVSDELIEHAVVCVCADFNREQPAKG